jgi:HD-GYP domain-containing protein (c-di-GMP phosphodiesterase class II)
MVRAGKDAIPSTEEPPPSQQPPTQEEPPGGAPAGVPKIDHPPHRDINNFPTFTGLYNEIGSIANVIDQINQISDFISGKPVQPSSAPQHPQQPPQQQPPQQQYPQQQYPQQQPLSPEEIQQRIQQLQQLQQQPIAPQQTEPGAEPPTQPGQQPTEEQQIYTPAGQPPPVPDEPEAIEELSEEAIEEIYEKLYQYVEGVMQAAQEGREFSIEPAFILISRAIDTARATDILYRRAIYTRESSDVHSFASSVVLHSVNVSIYAIKIGQGLSYNRNQLIDLGVSALLHDVGMVTLPPDLFSKGQFTQADIDLLHEHPAKGRAILQQLGTDYQWLSEVVYQEHEREDGNGYPQELKGNLIHEYAKIIGVADIYAGLTRSRPDRRGMLPFEAVKEILQTRKQEFDPRVVRILLKTLSAFPVGSLVKLNSGIVGRVIDTDTDSPLRPAIQIMFDIEGRPVQDKREILLREHPILHITDTVTMEEMGVKPGS